MVKTFGEVWQSQSILRLALFPRAYIAGLGDMERWAGLRTAAETISRSTDLEILFLVFGIA